jgi:hypothetical protein
MKLTKRRNKLLSENDQKIDLNFNFLFFFLQWKRYISLTNQQQLDCLLKHIEHSQNLNLWNKQTENSCNGINSKNISSSKKQKRIQIITPYSSPPSNHRSVAESSINRVQQTKSKQEWVVLPVFVDIVKLALKAREDCSTR